MIRLRRNRVDRISWGDVGILKRWERATKENVKTKKPANAATSAGLDLDFCDCRLTQATADPPSRCALRRDTLIQGFFVSNLIVFRMPASFGSSVCPAGNLFALNTNERMSAFCCPESEP